MAKTPNINPAAFSIEQLAAVLTSAGGVKVSVADVQRSIDAGAPTNGDGTIHLVHFTAWLAGRVN